MRSSLVSQPCRGENRQRGHPLLWTTCGQSCGYAVYGAGNSVNFGECSGITLWVEKYPLTRTFVHARVREPTRKRCREPAQGLGPLVGPGNTIVRERSSTSRGPGGNPEHTTGSPIGRLVRATSRGGKGRFARATLGQPGGRWWVRDRGEQSPGSHGSDPYMALARQRQLRRARQVSESRVTTSARSLVDDLDLGSPEGAPSNRLHLRGSRRRRERSWFTDSAFVARR